MPDEVQLGFAGWLMQLMPLLLIAAWAASCFWAISRLRRLEIALVSQVIWGAVILLFPLVGVLAFVMLGERTPQMERELGIRRLT